MEGRWLHLKPRLPPPLQLHQRLVWLMQPPRSAKLPISTLLHCIQFTANHCNAQGLVVSNVKPGGTFELQHENPKCALLCGQHLMLMVAKIYGEP